MSVAVSEMCLHIRQTSHQVAGSGDENLPRYLNGGGVMVLQECFSAVPDNNSFIYSFNFNILSQLRMLKKSAVILRFRRKVNN